MLDTLMKYKKTIVLFIIIFVIAYILNYISRIITKQLVNEESMHNSVEQINNGVLFWFLGLSLFAFVMP